MEPVTLRAPLRAPLRACLWLTDDCNLACKYCYAAPFSGGYMEKGRFFELFEELQRLQVLRITLAGGEPFLHPDIYEILEWCSRRQAVIGLLTNGTLLDEDAIRRLVPLFARNPNWLLQVSLDSVAAADNDFTRGQAALVVENIQRLLLAGIRLQIACVITTRNLRTATSLIDAFYPQVKSFHFMNLQRTQMALRHPGLFPTEAETHAFWLRLREHAEGFPGIQIPSLKTYFGTQEAWMTASPKSSFNPVTCAVAFSQVEISAHFDVFGCDIAKELSFLGNVRQRSLAEVWHSETAATVRQSEAPLCGLRGGTCCNAKGTAKTAPVALAAGSR